MQIQLLNFEQIAAWCEGQPGVVKVLPSEMIIVFEGSHTKFVNASYGWWVIKAANGVFYPMRRDKFKRKYEEVVDGNQPVL